MADLQQAGYLTVTRIGCRNHYGVEADLPFRDPADATPLGSVQALLDLFNRLSYGPAPADAAALGGQR